ncbi:MBL fold metallo-hydrolase [Agromyces aureus]|uniref:MBL fold metallo-hydrolase n=1 Tax=Agromyces aureus TaxID=453304 RepID=A0A191WEP0_9MICO|nr:MBL fold metallo-hydrolase [Agromyces aureus]ANJ26692.1 MBL fold metallo-hydrolase [Agromyces aureus]
MRLTKLEHAALLIEGSGDRLFIDPGNYTTPITDATGAVAVVITHEHADHWSPEQLRRIVDASPEVRLFGPAGVAAAASDFAIETVAPGDVIEIGPFRLRFFGGRHAEIHSSIDIVDNIGVIVNEAFAYAGDSFDVPEGLDVDVLAAPAGAPWMKISESIDFVRKVAPKRVFATHEMVLSQFGKDLSHTRLAWAVEQTGGEYVRLEPGDTLDF